MVDHGSLLRRTVPVLLCAFAISSCGLATDNGSSRPTHSGKGHYPVTVENCGKKVTFDHAPRRVLLLRSNQVVYLHDLGVMDRVIGRAGEFPDVYYDADTNAEIDKIPSMSKDLDARGHVQISQESIIERNPDLVLGLPEGVSQEGLAKNGIPSLLEPAYCPKGIAHPDFDDVYAEMTMFGKVFNRERQASRAVTDLQHRVRKVERSIARSGKTAAVLFPTVGGGAVKAYGARSMADPQLKAAGLRNVFGKEDKRLFEVSQAELLDRDPDVLILLHVAGRPGPVRKAITTMPGGKGLSAVQNDAILVQRFNFTEPPTPVASDGLERIARFTKGLP